MLISRYLSARLRYSGLDTSIAECPADLQVLTFDSAKKGGVYFLFRHDEVVYVGSATNIYHRVGKHSLDKELDTVKWIPAEPDQMRKIEGYWILALKPRLNGHTDALGNRKYFAPATADQAPVDPALKRKRKRKHSARIAAILEAARTETQNGVDFGLQRTEVATEISHRHAFAIATHVSLCGQELQSRWAPNWCVEYIAIRAKEGAQ